jgi:signal transduction histidine kinase
LIVTIAAPAASFFQRHRQQLFPSTPMLITALEQRRVALSAVTANDTVVATTIDFVSSFENILRVLPETANIAVVMGDSPIERYWVEQIRKELQPFSDRIAFSWLNDLSLDQMVKRVAVLPPRSAIFFGILSVDAAGVPHEETKALRKLRAAANAPIFSYSDAFFGDGIVGGPLLRVEDVGRQAANVAMRILAGEAPGGIKTPPTHFGAPKFDWRELQRWNISESRLPEGRETHFRSPSMWEQYRSQVTAGLAALLIQAAIISWLLTERRRRYFAEAEASSRRREVVRLNRVTTANVLSSSIAHELNQPLGAILSNTEAAQILLKANRPDLGQIAEILSDIIRDEQRASEIIAGLRNLLNNRTETDLRTVELNDAVRDVVKVIAPEVERRGVVLRTLLASEALPVRCDPIHLQQVLINLVVNGLDAMEEEPWPHNLTVKTARDADGDGVEVRISDSGKGIPTDKLTSIFDAFVTTKPQGMGLGLPIARTILESYGGDIWAENCQRGAIFSFRLPVAKTNAG